MSSLQQQEQTMKDLDNFETGFIPHFVLAIGEARYDYEISEYNLLTEQVSTIYKNINEYKDKKIEIWWEMGGDDYDTITLIQECKNCNEDICGCGEEELREYYERRKEESEEEEEEEEIRNIDTKSS